MRSSTLFHCFGLLTIITVFALVGQFLFTTFSSESASSIYRIFPVSSLPIVAEKIRQESSPGEAEAKDSSSQVILILHNGKEIRGRQVSRDDKTITLEIDGSKVGFETDEIKEVFENSE